MKRFAFETWLSWWTLTQGVCRQGVEFFADPASHVLPSCRRSLRILARPPHTRKTTTRTLFHQHSHQHIHFLTSLPAPLPLTDSRIFHTQAGLLLVGALAFLGSSAGSVVTRALMLWAAMFAICSALLGQMLASYYANQTDFDLQSVWGRPLIRPRTSWSPTQPGQPSHWHRSYRVMHVLLGLNATFLVYSTLSFAAGLGIYLFKDSGLHRKATWPLAGVALACISVPAAMFVIVNVSRKARSCSVQLGCEGTMGPDRTCPGPLLAFLPPTQAFGPRTTVH